MLYMLKIIIKYRSVAFLRTLYTKSMHLVMLKKSSLDRILSTNDLYIPRVFSIIISSIVNVLVHQAWFLLSSSSSGVPSLHAQLSTNLSVSRSHNLFISNNRAGTSAMMMTGNAGATTVNVT